MKMKRSAYDSYALLGRGMSSQSGERSSSRRSGFNGKSWNAINVSADFDGPTMPFRARDSKNISFCILGVSKEAHGFTTQVEFRMRG